MMSASRHLLVLVAALLAGCAGPARVAPPPPAGPPSPAVSPTARPGAAETLWTHETGG